MCSYHERQGCSYLAYDINLLPGGGRVRNGVWPRSSADRLCCVWVRRAVVKGTWAPAQINLVADWTVNCNYLSHTFPTLPVIYPPPQRPFFSPRLGASFQISPANVNRLGPPSCQLGRPNNRNLVFPHLEAILLEGMDPDPLACLLASWQHCKTIIVNYLRQGKWVKLDNCWFWRNWKIELVELYTSIQKSSAWLKQVLVTLIWIVPIKQMWPCCSHALLILSFSRWNLHDSLKIFDLASKSISVHVTQTCSQFVNADEHRPNRFP